MARPLLSGFEGMMVSNLLAGNVLQFLGEVKGGTAEPVVRVCVGTSGAEPPIPPENH